MGTTKFCISCKQDQEIDKFATIRTSKDGRRDKCRNCYESWYDRNREKHLETMRKQREKNYDEIVCVQCDNAFMRSPSSRRLECKVCQGFSSRRPCPGCGELMTATSSHCTLCVDRSSTANGNWRGGKIVHKRGYVMLNIDGKYVFEHRLMMEDRIGRILTDYENVHHINGIKNDNRIENLELWAKAQPAGCRAKDLLEWAKSIVKTYEPLEEKGLL